MIKYFVIAFLTSSHAIIDSANADMVDSLMSRNQSNREDFVRCQYDVFGDIVFASNSKDECRKYIKENYPKHRVYDVSL